MLKESNLMGSHFLRDVIIGMEDGITVSIAFIAGTTVLFQNNDFILAGGTIVVILLSIAMGISGWISGLGEQRYYYHEISKIDSPDGYDAAERADRLKFYESIGFPEEMRQPAMIEIDDDNKKWIEFLRKFDLGPASHGSGENLKRGLIIGFSYALGGLIPLAAFIIEKEPGRVIFYSIASALVVLLILGYFKSKLTGNHPFSTVMSVMLSGGVVAICLHFIALLFK